MWCLSLRGTEHDKTGVLTSTVGRHENPVTSTGRYLFYFRLGCVELLMAETCVPLNNNHPHLWALPGCAAHITFVDDDEASRGAGAFRPISVSQIRPTRCLIVTTMPETSGVSSGCPFVSFVRCCPLAVSFEQVGLPRADIIIKTGGNGTLKSRACMAMMKRISLYSSEKWVHGDNPKKDVSHSAAAASSFRFRGTKNSAASLPLFFSA